MNKTGIQLLREYRKKQKAGRLGGLATVKARGSEWMREIGRRGAAAFHKKYRLTKLSTSDFAIVDRKTGVATGKTTRGLKIPEKQ